MIGDDALAISEAIKAGVYKDLRRIIPESESFIIHPTIKNGRIYIFAWFKDEDDGGYFFAHAEDSSYSRGVVDDFLRRFLPFGTKTIVLETNYNN
jgi:hypothetical protein